jgi:hypothetical protein
MLRDVIDVYSWVNRKILANETRRFEVDSMRMPGFTAHRSLATRPTAERDFATAQRRPIDDFENNLRGLLSPAEENEPGGPGTVPSGYGRDCHPVPYTVCVGRSCWTEYAWVCTYYRLMRA